jgi:hypothetical protein
VIAKGRGARRPSPVERLEGSTAGRVLLSIFIGFVVLGIVVFDLPESTLKSTASKATEPVINALGLNQNWNVFAPDPRRQSIFIEARVTMSDGSHRTWRPYVGGDLLGSYRDYRWGKYAENVRLDRNRQLWPALAEWVARHEGGGRLRVRRVVLVRHWRNVQPPGSRTSEGPRMTYAFYKRVWR